MQINLTPDASLIAIMVIFILNYFVVRKFFLKPVQDVLSWRETEIRGAEKAYEETLNRFNAATSRVWRRPSGPTSTNSPSMSSHRPTGRSNRSNSATVMN